jgi:MFS family permease
VAFLKEDLHFPSSVATYASAALLLGMVVSLGPWGKLADRHGNRFVLCVNVVLFAFALLLVATVVIYERVPWAGIALAMIAFLLTGVSLGGLGIGHTVRQMRGAPAAYRSAYMAVFFTTNGVLAGLASLLGGWILDHLPATVAFGGVLVVRAVPAYFVVAALLVLASLLLLRRTEHVAERPLRHIFADAFALLPPSLTLPLRLFDLDPHEPADDEAGAP